jgi:hypothetical protein
MSRFTFVVITEDFRFHYQACHVLRRRRIPHTSVSLGQRIPPCRGHVIVLVPREDRESVEQYYKENCPPIAAVVYQNDQEVEWAIEQAVTLAISCGDHIFHTLSIGLDPGRNVGIAAWGDGSLIFSDVMPFRLQKTASAVLNLIESFRAREVVVRVGTGSPIDTTASLLKILLEYLPPSATLERVNESHTSTRSSFSPLVSRAIDANSAARIALRKGNPVPQVSPTHPLTRGRIRELQIWSRLLSNGRITISRDLSRRVAKGELSLAEAVAEQQNKNSRA